MIFQLGQFLTLAHIYIVVKEWAEYDEFSNVEKVVIVGTKMQAMMVKLSLIQTPIHTYYCDKDDFDKKYRNRKRIKWIIVDSQTGRRTEGNKKNILVFPVL